MRRIAIGARGHKEKLETTIVYGGLIGDRKENGNYHTIWGGVIYYGDNGKENGN